MKHIFFRSFAECVSFAEQANEVEVSGLLVHLPPKSKAAHCAHLAACALAAGNTSGFVFEL
jgi:hypothetical protein